MSGCECLGRKRFELATCGQATVSRKDPSWHFTLVFPPPSLKHIAFLMYSGNTVEFEDRCWNAGRLSRGCFALQGHSDDWKKKKSSHIPADRFWSGMTGRCIDAIYLFFSSNLNIHYQSFLADVSLTVSMCSSWEGYRQTCIIHVKCNLKSVTRWHSL